MRILTLMMPLLALSAADMARGEGTVSTPAVAEIVTFRLVDGADSAAFIQSAEGMKPFLDSTGAVLSRTLSADEDGLWTDHIVWTSMAAAKTAAAQVMSRPEAAPFMALVDPDSVTMRHAPIHYLTAQE